MLNLRRWLLFLLPIGILAALYACNQYSRAVQSYEFPELKYFPSMPESDVNRVTVEGIKLGRYLFYDSILSLDYSMSCGSCHRQEVAFSDAPKQFSTGITGDTMDRNTMPLFNLAWYPAFFWDGKAQSLEQQVFFPVRAHDEMNLDWKEAVRRIRNHPQYPGWFRQAFGSRRIDSLLIARAIAQFERSLISNNSKYDSVIRREVLFTPEEYEGFILVNDQVKGDCLHCHTSDGDALGTTRQFSNNGLDRATAPGDFRDPGRGGISGKMEHYGQFKIPSLRNVAVTGPYMHDGRFRTLRDVLDFYSEDIEESYTLDSKMSLPHKGRNPLTEEEKDKIIAFLHTLTDYHFLSDTTLSNPFNNSRSGIR